MTTILIRLSTGSPGMRRDIDNWDGTGAPDEPDGLAVFEVLTEIAQRFRDGTVEGMDGYQVRDPAYPEPQVGMVTVTVSPEALLAFFRETSWGRLSQESRKVVSAVRGAYPSTLEAMGAIARTAAEMAGIVAGPFSPEDASAEDGTGNAKEGS